jgi:hypothetical protein
LDDTLQNYLNRVAKLTLPDSYHSGLQHIQSSPKYQPTAASGRQPVPFPGYSVMTPIWQEDPENTPFYQLLEQCQTQLLEQIPKALLVPVPPESFHFTLADLIWDDAYRHATAENPAFEEQLRNQIAQSFRQCEASVQKLAPIRWQLLGMMVRTRAIGVCLVPRDEKSYEGMIQLRRAIYQNAGLIALGVEQQYHFTAHITLGYFGEIQPDLNRQHLSQVLFEFNNRLSDMEPPELLVRRAELCKFEDMTQYERGSDWPVLELGNG